MAYKNLTWQDIRTIVQAADNVLDMTDKKELLAIGQEGYYNTVLYHVGKRMESENNKQNNE